MAELRVDRLEYGIVQVRTGRNGNYTIDFTDRESPSTDGLMCDKKTTSQAQIYRDERSYSASKIQLDHDFHFPLWMRRGLDRKFCLNVLVPLLMEEGSSTPWRMMSRGLRSWLR